MPLVVEATENRTPIGFRWHLSTNTAQNPLTIPTGILCVILLVLLKIYAPKTRWLEIL